MFKGLGDFASLLTQAKQMGGRLQAMSDELKSRHATGSAGGGLVQVEVNGLAQVLRVTIDPDIIARGDRELIEDLVPAAVNAAIAKAKAMHAEALKSLTGGIEIPGLNDMLAKFTGVENTKPDDAK